MTTYDTTTTVGKIRLLIGDTDTSDAVFTDAEINVFYALQGSINLAAAEALESWANKYAASPDSEKIGDYAYTQKIIANMLASAKRLRDKESTTPAFEWSEYDLTGIEDTTIEDE